MTVLNIMLTSIVFLPLVIISLLVIYAIAYSIWSYRTTEKYRHVFNYRKYLFYYNKTFNTCKIIRQFLYGYSIFWRV